MPRPAARPLALALALALASPAAQAARFVYEGRLDDLGQPANGRYDLKLTAFGHEAQDATLAAPVTFEGVDVKEGRFRLDVELPLVNADQVWLEVAVRETGNPGFSAIPGRSKAIAAPLIGACWSTLGDSGSNPATNFIGTTDAQPFVIRTRNAQSLRIEPSSITFGSPALPITTNTIGGSHANQVTAGVRGATIAGGGVPSGDSDPDFDAESPNRVTDAYGTVGGGYGNRAGQLNASTTDNAFATVGGGSGNGAEGLFSTIGGGVSNIANGVRSTVSGGTQNQAFGEHSTVSGGLRNCAGARFSWAGGREAHVRLGTFSGSVSFSGCAGVPPSGDADGDEGTFVWADSTFRNFVSTGPNQFLVRASGAVVLQRAIGSETSARAPRGYLNVVRGDSGLPQATAPDPTAVAVFENDNGANIFLIAGGTENKGLRFGDAVNASQGGISYTSGNNMQFRTNGNVVRMVLGNDGVLTLSTLGPAGTTSLCRNASNQISTCSSSARYKHDIADLELGLATALRLHAVGYRWKGTDAPDIGFVAEEIAAIDERLVTRNDRGEIEGVKYDRLTAVLANAVQELAARDSVAAEDLARLGAENAALRAELERRDGEYRSRLERLEARLERY